MTGARGPAPRSEPRSELIVVSAADSGYFALLQDTVQSVRDQRPEAAIGILDLGLAAEERAWLVERVTHIVRPGWDVDFPGRDRTPERFKAQVARPFLPRHFPGYEIYFWLDADAWMQCGRVVDLYRDAAGRERIAIAPEIDRAYKRHYKRPKAFGWTLTWKVYREAFGWRAAERLGRNPMVNCGVFALHRDAPHWQAWARLIGGVLQRTRFFYAEQAALNYAIFAERLPANFLPAYCNWMPGDAAPAFDGRRGLFVEPYAPHEAIGVMHLAGREQKDQVFTLARLEGGTVATGLRYRDTRALCRATAAE